jgi:predicted transport protein
LAHNAYPTLGLTIEAFIARLQTAQVLDLLSYAEKRNWVKNLLADLSSRNFIAPERKGPDKSFAEALANLPEPMQLLLASLEDYTFSLGDDVQRKELRLYAAFKRLKNFATVVLHRKNCLLLYLHVDPATALLVLPNARDVTSIGHWGTGNLEVPLTSQADLDAVKPFINAAYEGRG